MNRHARIAEHRLGTRRRHFDVAAAVLERIAKVPEMTGFGDVLDLDIAQRRIAMRTPIGDAGAAIDEPLLVERRENFSDGFRAALVHRKSLARPIARRAECFQLMQNSTAVFLLPLPHALQKFFAPELISIGALRAERFFDARLCRNPRVIATGHPQCFLALHSMIADQNILQSVVERVPHVQLPRHIRRRDHDAVGFRRRIFIRAEVIMRLPKIVDLLFK